MKRLFISLLIISSLSIVNVQAMEEEFNPDIPAEPVLSAEDFLSGAKKEDIIRVASTLKFVIAPEYEDQTSWHKLSFSFKKYAQFIANFLKTTPNVRACTLALAKQITQDRDPSSNRYFLTNCQIVELLTDADKLGSPILFNALVCATMDDKKTFSRFIENKSLKDRVEWTVKKQEVYQAIDQTRRVDLQISLPECVEDGYLQPENPLDNFFSFCDYIQEVRSTFSENTDNLLNIKNYSIVTNKNYKLEDIICRTLEKATQQILASTKAKIAAYEFDKKKHSLDSLLAKFQDSTCKNICLRAMVEWLQRPENLDLNDRHSTLTFFNAHPEGLVKMAIRFLYTGEALDNLDITIVRTALQSDRQTIYLDSCFTGDNDPVLAHLGIILELAQPLYRNFLDSVWLRGNNLTRIPDAVCNLKTLKKLYLSHNQISEISPKISNAKKLDSLYLDNNQLQSIPKELNLLPMLNTLSLKSNAITTLPATLSNNAPIFIYLANNPDFCENNLPVELRNTNGISIFT